jgi:hypothetical protein
MMLTGKRLGILVLAFLLAVQGAYAEEPDPNVVIQPIPLGDALGAVADDLVSNQVSSAAPFSTGWPGMENYNGAITLGMVSAYNIFGVGSYGYSAKAGAGWLYHDSIVRTPLGDSVLAWDALGVSEYEYGIGVWSDVAASFFDNVQTFTPSEAAGYVASFGGDAGSTVYYLANLTVAAYGVDAPQKDVWRQGLVQALNAVNDDSALFPVQAIGTATWALATTGPLDSTLINSDPNAPIWGGVALSDLPDVLVSHQVPDGGYDAGSFFWRIDHTAGGLDVVAEGYTSDAIFATLGLFAAADSDPNIVPGLQGPIVEAIKAVIGALGDDGIVYEHLSLGGEASYVYSAQMLLLADVTGVGLDVDLNYLSEVNTYEDLGIVIESPLVWNPSFELPATTKQTNFENVVGWTSDEGEVTDSGVEEGYTATDGTWTAFLKGGDPAVYQITKHIIDGSDIIQLAVDARITWQATTLQMGIFYIDDTGAPVIVALSQVDLTDEMANYSLVLVAADVPDAVGKPLGIGFDNVTDVDASWLGLDNVTVDFLAEVPVVVDPNAGL